MCCIGLVEDVTIDYLSQTYELKIRKRTDDEFKQFMLEFFKKYYSHEQALKKVKEIDVDDVKEQLQNKIEEIKESCHAIFPEKQKKYQNSPLRFALG